MRHVDILASKADNEIVETAINLKEKGHDVTLLTTDRNMRITARGYGIDADDCASYTETEMPPKVEALIGVCIMLFLVAIGFVFFSPDLPMKYLGLTQAQAIALIIGGGVVAIIITAITVRSYRSVKKKEYKEEGSIFERDILLNPEYSAIHGNIYNDD